MLTESDYVFTSCGILNRGVLAVVYAVVTFKWLKVFHCVYIGNSNSRFQTLRAMCTEVS